MTDLGNIAEGDLSDTVRAQIQGVGEGQASRVDIAGDSASMIVVCSREESSEGVPTKNEIENRLFEAELTGRATHARTGGHRG